VTDPDSRDVKTPRSYTQGYNAQAVVNEHQVGVPRTNQGGSRRGSDCWCGAVSEMEGPVFGLVVLRGRPAGGGRKPRQAAAVKSRGGERCGQVASLSAAGVDQEGERRRSTDDVSKAQR
jgi:hypothetical protein